MPVPKGVDPDKYDRCVDDVKGKGDAKNAYAVCAASLKRNELDWSGTEIQKNIAEFNQLIKGRMKKVVHGTIETSSSETEKK